MGILHPEILQELPRVRRKAMKIKNTKHIEVKGIGYAEVTTDEGTLLLRCVEDGATFSHEHCNAVLLNKDDRYWQVFREKKCISKIPAAVYSKERIIDILIDFDKAYAKIN